MERQDNQAAHAEVRNVSIDSFVPHGESYYLKVMSALERYVEGKNKSVA